MLAQTVSAFARGRGPVAVDSERASGYRYGQRAFLVQLRRNGTGTALIDTEACRDLSDLSAVLESAEVVLHAATQDLPCLDELGFRPRRVFDTELAGRLLGYPKVGLGGLVESVLCLHLEKGHAAVDWSRRPLPREWLRYAALDVEVLIELRDALGEELRETGKLAWAREEFAAVLATPQPPPRRDPWRRTSGIHRVRNRRGLAVVRALWETRDDLARRLDLAPGRLLSDAGVVEAAITLPRSSRQLIKLPQFATRNAKRHVRMWFSAISSALAQPESELPELTLQGEGPPPTNRWAERDPMAVQRLASTRAVVAEIAAERLIPVENLLQPDTLRRLAWSPPSNPTPEAVAAELRRRGARHWQIELVGKPLADALHPEGRR